MQNHKKVRSENAKLRKNQNQVASVVLLNEGKSLVELHLENLLRESIKAPRGYSVKPEDRSKCSNCDKAGFRQAEGFEADDLEVPDYINLIWYSKRFKREVCLNCNAPGWKLALLGQKPKKLQELAKMSARERKALRRKGYQK